MAGEELGGGGAIQAAQQQQTTTTNAETVALQHQEAAAQEAVAAQAATASAPVVGKTIKNDLGTFNTWEPNYLVGIDNNNKNVYGTNPYYDPNAIAPAAPTDVHGKLLSITYGATPEQYEQVPTGERAPWETGGGQSAPNPNYDPNYFATHGPTIYMGQLYSATPNGNVDNYRTYSVAPSDQRFTTNAYGTTISNPFYNPATVKAPPVDTTPQDPLYLTWVGGRTPSLSAVQTPGSVLYTGPRNFTGAGAGSLASVLGYGAGYTSPNGGSSSSGGEGGYNKTGSNGGGGGGSMAALYGLESVGGSYRVASPAATSAPSMAGTPVSGAPGVFFTGDISSAPTIKTNTSLDAGGSIPTPFSSNAATARSSPATDVKFIEPQYSAEMFNSITGGLDTSEKARVAGPKPYTGPEFFAPVIAAGVGVATVASEAGKGWYEAVDKTAFSIADTQTAIVPIPGMNVINNAGAETVSFVAGGIPAFFLGLPKVGVDVVANPAAVPASAVNFVGESIEGVKKKNEERPGAIIGDVVGFAIAGKVTGRAVETGAKYSPVGLDVATIPTAEGTASNTVATVFTRNPLSMNPATPRAFVMAGSEVEGIQYGRGSPVPRAIEQGISAQSPALFNVRDTSITATPAQVRFLDPFFREVSKGSEAEPIVNAMFDLKQALPRSEAAINYADVQAQPIGSAKQVGISPETKAAVFESLAETAPETRYVGSQALAETIGEKYTRPVLESDIDLSMKSESFNPSFQALKEVYAQEPTSTVTGGQSARGYSFTTSALKGEHTLGVVGETTDVRTYNARTAEGSIIKTQTPEYAIESKASRTLGPDIGLGGRPQAPSRLTYTPEEGTSFELGGKKPASDLADIYAASRGIARSAYQEKYYDLGKTYEGISENVKKYAETTGTAEKIATIPEDALAGVQKAPIRPGQVLGINLDIFPAAEAVEYPLYNAPKAPEVPIVPLVDTYSTTTATTSKAATPELPTQASEKAVEAVNKVDTNYPEQAQGNAYGKGKNPNTFSGYTPADYVTSTPEPVRGSNPNTFSGYTPEDYIKATYPEQAKGNANGRGNNPNTFSGYTPEDYVKAEKTKGPNQNTFSGWTPEDYVKASKVDKTESTTYPSAKTAEASTMLMSSSYATSGAESASSGYATAPAAYAPSSSASAFYPGVAIPYSGSYPLAGAPQAAAYPVGYPRGGETTYPTSYPTTAPTTYPKTAATTSRTTTGKPFEPLVIPQKIPIVPTEDKFRKKPKRKVSKGKKFGEVFSFDVDKNFKTPERLTRKSNPKRFTETFGMDTKNTFTKSTFGKLAPPFESINTSKKKRSK